MANRPILRTSALALCIGGLAACSGAADEEATAPTTSQSGDTSTTSPPGPDATISSSGPDEASTSAVAAPGLGGELEVLDVTVTAPREVVTLDDGALLISDQAGLVHVVGADGTARTEPLLDVSDSINTPNRRALEAGLAGFALAPDFAESGHFYTTTTHSPDDINASLPQGTRQVSVLSRWTADPATLVTDPDSEEQLMLLPSRDADHVGGEIVFDDQGLLYTALGAPSRDEVAQDPHSYPGTVLRIDPTPAEGAAQEDRAYGIPEDNPFADGEGGLPEIYSYGYRNPWRLTWDAEHGLLVGEAMSRDKDQQLGQPAPGDDAGYPEVSGACWEGDQVADACQETEAGVPIAPPVLEYGPQVGEILSGVAIGTGGDLQGRVVVTDWLGDVLVADAGPAPWNYEVLTDGQEIVGRASYLWDVDAEPDGSLYVLTADRALSDGGGAVHRLAP
ncbi:PQQ-dependent sugar dehydrogenase [Ornithinimicrobium faecis]|uniref:PQQ-dependent sugar dehydrogenase n=1 Tax=Ornithinimicrobium faecis TaxID=2934158 RepID=UPI0021198C65|nr:PQQ-dependent sugar dehydrogenase [Ornithinimicrobium sp. HY1745]